MQDDCIPSGCRSVVLFAASYTRQWLRIAEVAADNNRGEQRGIMAWLIVDTRG